MLTRRIIVVSLAIPLLGCASVTESSKKAESKPPIVVDTSVTQDAMPAWIVYAASFGVCMEKGTPYDSFQAELEAREVAVHVWQNLKEKDNRTDAYLDSLVTIEKAGYLREYVWTYFRVPAWGAPPEGLKLTEFWDWRAGHLRGHKPQTLAMLESPKSEKPVSAWTRDAEKDTYTHYYSGYCFPRIVGPFERGDVHDFDANERDVSVGYDAMGPIILTAYVYPFGSPVSEATESLDAEFKLRKDEIRKMHFGAMMLSEGQRMLTMQGKTRPAVEALFEFTDDRTGRREELHSRLILCADGDNFFKIRVTYPQSIEAKAAEAIDAFIVNFHAP